MRNVTLFDCEQLRVIAYDGLLGDVGTRVGELVQTHQCEHSEGGAATCTLCIAAITLAEFRRILISALADGTARASIP